MSAAVVLMSSFLAAQAPLLTQSPATPVLSAIEGGDAGAVSAMLAPDFLIIDYSTGEYAYSTVEALITYARGCDRTDHYWHDDGENPTSGVASVYWTCPSRPRSEAYIWTNAGTPVHIQFGAPPESLSIPAGERVNEPSNH